MGFYHGGICGCGTNEGGRNTISAYKGRKPSSGQKREGGVLHLRKRAVFIQKNVRQSRGEKKKGKTLSKGLAKDFYTTLAERPRPLELALPGQKRTSPFQSRKKTILGRRHAVKKVMSSFGRKRNPRGKGRGRNHCPSLTVKRERQ